MKNNWMFMWARECCMKRGNSTRAALTDNESCHTSMLDGMISFMVKLCHKYRAKCGI